MADGMHALRMGAAALSIDEPSVDDLSAETGLAQAIRITARMPALVAHHYRLRNRQEIVEPRDDLGFAAGYLYMLEGTEPNPARVEALDAYMVAIIEHGMNASTFTARVISSTNSDIVSSVTGAIGALKGPLHGGVPGPVIDMLREIGSADRAEGWVRAALARGERIMGFGHRVYKVRDPRAEVLENAAEKLAKVSGSAELLHLTRAVEEVTVKVLGEAKPGLHLYANTELYAATVLHGVGIPSKIFTPTFAIARTAGWTAHILEQRRDNRLIRPESIYDGPRDRHFIPLETR
jgi:citrate synthase